MGLFANKCNIAFIGMLCAISDINVKYGIKRF